MTVSEILKKCKKMLAKDGDMLGVEVLLAFVLNKKREDFLVHPEFEISPEHESEFYMSFEKFLKGVPVAYLTHSKEFYGLDFYVDERVLIPRPETELLVEKVILYSENCDDARPLRILDVGTGSGCISVTLAQHIPSAFITAVDISTDVLRVTRLNAEKHHVSEKIQFLQSDLLAQLPPESSFEVIAANLPYIGKEKFNFISESTERYEPHLALFGGDDGLRLYEEFFRQLSSRSDNFKMLLVEFGFFQADEIQKIAKRYFPKRHFEILKDYANIDRILIISGASSY